MQQVTIGAELAQPVSNDMPGRDAFRSSNSTRRQGLYHCLLQAGEVDLRNGLTH